MLNTPFDTSGAVALEALRANVRYAIDAGVAGFLVPALASEVGKLSRDERMEMVRAVVAEARGKAVVIGGASAPTSDERCALATMFTGLGCDGVLAAIAFEDEAQYTRDITALAATAPGFLMVQDWDFNGFGAPVDVVARLFEEIDAFRCLKVEVVPAGVKYSALIAATNGRLHVSGGWAVQQIVEALDRGVHAFMPTGLHHSYCAIVRRYLRGDRAGALALHEELLPILAFSNQHLDISIHFFKRLLHRQGIYPTASSREPILPFDAYHERMADALIERAIALEARVKAEEAR